MMSQKLSDISQEPGGAGLLFDPTPGRSSDARNPAERESWVSMTTDGSLEIKDQDDAERRRRHSLAESGNE